MSLSSFIRVGQFKSPVRVLAAVFLRSRETQAKRAREKSEEIQNLQRVEQHQQTVIAKVEQELAQMKPVMIAEPWLTDWSNLFVNPKRNWRQVRGCR